MSPGLLVSETGTRSQQDGQPASSSRRTLVPLASLLLVVAGFGIGLAGLWPLLHQQWTEVNDYNHGYLMLAMAGWLAWRRWREQPPRQLAPDWRWLFPLGGVLAILLLMELVFLNVPRLYVLPLLVVAATGLVFGREAAHRVLWPALLLYFAMPFWAALAGHLQALTTRVNTWLLELAAVPAYIEGNFVYLPAGAFEIAEGCSGLNYLIVGMSLGAFYGLAFLRTWPARLALFAVAVAVTLVSNWLRVYIIIMAGYLTDMEHYLVRVDHISFGWVLFAVVLVPVLFCAGWLERRGSSRARPGGDPVPGGSAASSASTNPVPMLGAAALCAVLLLLPGALNSIGAGGDVAPEPTALSADEAMRYTPTLDWQPVFDGGQVERAARVVDGQVIETYRAWYPRQRREARVIRYHHSFTGETWRPVGREVRELRFGNDTRAVIEFHGYASGQEALMWAWYEVGGRQATSNLGVKLQEVAALARGRRDAGAVAIASACRPDCAHAAASLQAYLQTTATGPDEGPSRGRAP